MEPTKLWAEHKKVIVTTAIAAVVAMVVIKFFNVIFWGSILVAFCVAVVLTYLQLAKKYGGPEGVWNAAMKEMWKK